MSKKIQKSNFKITTWKIQGIQTFDNNMICESPHSHQVLFSKWIEKHLVVAKHFVEKELWNA